MSGETAQSIVMNIHGILKLLPHRYPFLLVDRVLELDRGKVILARKNVTINEPFFLGHFPSRPVMPGVLQIEAMAQTAALLMCSPEGNMLDESHVFLFTAIDNARFKRVVEPGDCLDIRVEFVRAKAGLYKFKAVASVAAEVASEADLMCTVRQVDGV